jgi:hypothetical protein
MRILEDLGAALLKDFDRANAKSDQRCLGQPDVDARQGHGRTFDRDSLGGGDSASAAQSALRMEVRA